METLDQKLIDLKTNDKEISNGNNSADILCIECELHPPVLYYIPVLHTCRLQGWAENGYGTLWRNLMKSLSGPKKTSPTHASSGIQTHDPPPCQ